jgi:hypothetical protein
MKPGVAFFLAGATTTMYMGLVLVAIMIVLYAAMQYIASAVPTYEAMTQQSLEYNGDLLAPPEFPWTGRTGVSAASGSTIWRDQPNGVEVGNYTQTTNNLRYPPSPDDGWCTPALFCNALYKKIVVDNVAKWLPPVADTGQVRVNYYHTAVPRFDPFSDNGMLNY